MDLVKRLHAIQTSGDVQREAAAPLHEFVKEYQDLFDGLGCSAGEHTIKVGHSVRPSCYTPTKTSTTVP